MLISTLLTIVLLAAAAAVPPDITVAADGSGDFTTVQAAMESISRGNRERMIVLVKDGKGSELVGQLVAKGLARVVPELAPHIRSKAAEEVKVQ